ncbi:DNA-directed RNA polymerase II subunit rpb4, variant 2 [Balamuthia mandrillaris]
MDRTRPEEEEDATQLKLGQDFHEAQCLLNSEVAILLEHRQQNAPEDSESEQSPVFLKTLAYVQRFSRYKNKTAVKQVRTYDSSDLLSFVLSSASPLSSMVG